MEAGKGWRQGQVMESLGRAGEAGRGGRRADGVAATRHRPWVVVPGGGRRRWCWCGGSRREVRGGLGGATAVGGGQSGTTAWVVEEAVAAVQ
jgi:hypothetical protein